MAISKFHYHLYELELPSVGQRGHIIERLREAFPRKFTSVKVLTICSCIEGRPKGPMLSFNNLYHNFSNTFICDFFQPVNKFVGEIPLGTFKKIGVLGGMGPEATVLLMQRVIESVSAQDDSDHIPMIIDNNTQVPSRIKAIIEKQGESPAPALQQMAQRLEAAGATALVMPCNTAHHYAQDIEACCSIPLLNMIELTADKIAKSASNSSKVGILASPAVRMTELYTNAFKRRNIEFLHTKADMKLVEIIKMIKGEGVTPEALIKLNTIATELEVEGATHLLVACTEFSLASREIATNALIVDSLEVLTQAAVSFATN